ncbi:hypothetical protein IQ254_29540 [Nodosilinea sp. LEGE 07088]|uniref:hypothetical protein n=1 Tax=Nodosilinea sp. LEGE 07088 TaxID=2777968 RepID=UPI00187EE9F1|nr:hypothetical protein [Nodosilinea sp. LEGE 07088]MBE9141286.1 hypothetical protein [Nodosilinea sp. LEGE 07088]
MAIETNKALLNEAAYRIVSEIAPEEIPVYVETRDRYFADPDEFMQASSDDDEVLGIGEVFAVKTLTKVVFPLLTPILNYLLQAVTETVQEELGEEASTWVKQLFTPDQPPQPIFTQAELAVIAATIRDIAATEADRLRLDPDQASTVSDAVIARLALAQQ